jgi:hypothetical protein
VFLVGGVGEEVYPDILWLLTPARTVHRRSTALLLALGLLLQHMERAVFVKFVRAEREPGRPRPNEKVEHELEEIFPVAEIVAEALAGVFELLAAPAAAVGGEVFGVLVPGAECGFERAEVFPEDVGWLISLLDFDESILVRKLLSLLPLILTQPRYITRTLSAASAALPAALPVLRGVHGLRDRFETGLIINLLIQQSVLTSIFALKRQQIVETIHRTLTLYAALPTEIFLARAERSHGRNSVFALLVRIRAVLRPLSVGLAAFALLWMDLDSGAWDALSAGEFLRSRVWHALGVWLRCSYVVLPGIVLCGWEGVVTIAMRTPPKTRTQTLKTTRKAPRNPLPDVE